MTSKPSTLTQVRIERAEGVGTITINRPDLLNTVTPALVQQMRWAFDEVSSDPEVRGIVIAGEGRVFSVGAEIGFLLRNIEAGDMSRIMAVTYAAHDLFNVMDDCPKPVIARVHGVTIGAGVEIILSCDHVVACPQATFCLPETGLGIFPCLGGTQRTTRAIGPGLAKWMMYTGKSISANEALQMGLIDEIAAPDELDAVCRCSAQGPLSRKRKPVLSRQLATLAAFFERYKVDQLRGGSADTGGDPVLERAMKSVAAKAPIALQFVERLIDVGSRRPFAEGLQMEIDHVMQIYRTADAYKGLLFRTKKPVGVPVFEGR
jgi:enoyl-CoA hydratase/3-hydroxyacyl-CoA dehydrogenase